MLTSMRAVDNLYGEQHDLWEVNAEDEYLEEGDTKQSPYPYQAGKTPSGEVGLHDDVAIRTGEGVSGK
jgi:hypothetical protein